MKKKIGLSAVVAEMAEPGSPMEQLLLKGGLHEDPEFTQEDLNSKYQDAGGDDLLSLVAWEDWRVISLEEETAAQEGWAAAGRDMVKVNTNEVSLISSSKFFEGAESLFTEEDVRRLKLTAVTSADLNERIRAIRQLLLSSAPANAKASVFINLLGDPDARIRTEAANALEGLGLNTNVAGAIGDMAEGNSKQRLLAARRLTPLIENGGELEVFVIARSLLRSLDSESELEVREAILEAFTSAGPQISKHEVEREAVVQILVQQLREFPDRLRPQTTKALQALAQDFNTPVVRQLWDQIRNESELKTRIHILCFLSTREMPEDIEAVVIERMAIELANLRSNDEDSIRLGNLLLHHGENTCRSLLDALPEAHHLQRTHIVEILDRVASDSERPVSTELKVEVARMFLSSLKTAELNVRLAIIQGDLVADPNIDQETRHQLISEIFANLHDYNNPRTAGLVESTISGMGLSAVEPLLSIVQHATRHESRKEALLVLGKVFTKLIKSKEPVQEIAAKSIKLCRELAAGESVEMAGAAMDTLGDICSCPLIPPKLLEEVSGGLRESLSTSSRAFELLHALGKICGNPSTPIQERLDTTNLFLQLFRSDLPEVSQEVTEVDFERIYAFGNEILAYTDMLPTLLQGFKDIILSPQMPVSLRERILAALLSKWETVLDYREIWGPGNQSLMLKMLKEIALSDITPEENLLKIFNQIRVQYERPPYLAATGEISIARQDLPSIGDAAAVTLKAALAYWVDRDRIERSDEPSILMALGRLIAVHKLGDDPAVEGQLRARVLDLLYNALRQKVKGVDLVLKELTTRSGLPEKLKEEIQSRLKNAFALRLR
ncbi:MAG: hypothetical protein O3B01_22615 [Planctomycetota bacterium]|nr:hypothetical protein [Planctomycetota bacterium]MDA1141364.1 hypothetical protein [Planctomycetota bacterium]